MTRPLEFPDDLTGDVLRRFQEDGADFTKLHTVEFFILFEDTESAERCARDIGRDGRYAVTVRPRDADEAGVELQADRRMLLDHAALTDAEAEIDACAARHSGTPDGWGAFQED